MIAEDQLRAQMMVLLPRLRRFALALTSRPADADDMDSWMFRIAQNLWIDKLRAQKVRAGTVNDLTEAENLAFDGERAAEAHSMLAATLRALEQLPQEQREVVALVLIDGISYREAAVILELPIGTVTSRLARAREALAARVLGAGTLAENALQ